MKLNPYETAFVSNCDDFVRQLARDRNATRCTVQYLSKIIRLYNLGPHGENTYHMRQDLLEEFRIASKDWYEVTHLTWIHYGEGLVGFRLTGIGPV